MGNCQAAEAATVVIQHPCGRVERAYWSLSATQVMAANPGHYVAVLIDANESRFPPAAVRSAVAVSDTSSFSCTYRGGGSSSSTSSGRARAAAPVKHLKLLRPDDTLHIGHVYRLVSFEEVLREFASKKHVKLSRLLAKPKEKTTSSSRSRRGNSGPTSSGGGRRRPPRRSGRSRAAEPDISPATTESAPEEEGEARVDAELEEVVRRMMAMECSSSITARSRANFGGGAHGRQRQWRPALQSIAEVGR